MQQALSSSGRLKHAMEAMEALGRTLLALSIMHAPSYRLCSCCCNPNSMMWLRSAVQQTLSIIATNATVAFTCCATALQSKPDVDRCMLLLILSYSCFHCLNVQAATLSWDNTLWHVVQ